MWEHNSEEMLEQLIFRNNSIIYGNKKLISKTFRNEMNEGQQDKKQEEEMKELNILDCCKGIDFL